jgi:hypothetical protein
MINIYTLAGTWYVRFAEGTRAARWNGHCLGFESLAKAKAWAEDETLPIPASLIELALEAAQDPAMCPVLGDALLESEFPTKAAVKVWELINHTKHFSFWSKDVVFDCEAFCRLYFQQNAEATTPTFAQALAAVGLTQRWQTTPWRKGLTLYG